MSEWDEDISNYCKSRSREPSKVEGILSREGWESTKYKASMKDALFAWLDQWYTLSIKNLPTPATSGSSLRCNPSVSSFETYKRVTKLPDGQQVTTSMLSKGKYLTKSNVWQQYAKIDGSQEDADITHIQFIEEILYG